MTLRSLLRYIRSVAPGVNELAATKIRRGQLIYCLPGLLIRRKQRFSATSLVCRFTAFLFVRELRTIDIIELKLQTTYVTKGTS